MASFSGIIPRPHHPPALPHGRLEKIFEDIFMVTGTVQMTIFGCCNCRFSRNMQVIRQQQPGDSNNSKKELILVNTVRLNEEGLKDLDALGIVQHVIRIGGYHGMDDPFYKERYPTATVWTIQENVPYFSQFDAEATPYFQADRSLSNIPSGEVFPINNTELIVVDSKEPKDGILLLHRPEGKIFITGDSLQNFETCHDIGFNWMGKAMMTSIGFIHPCQVGPMWKKAQNVPKHQVAKLLEHRFDHVLPAHGRPVVGQAYEKYEPAVENW